MPELRTEIAEIQMSEGATMTSDDWKAVNSLKRAFIKTMGKKSEEGFNNALAQVGLSREDILLNTNNFDYDFARIICVYTAYKNGKWAQVRPSFPVKSKINERTTNTLFND